MKSFFLLVFMIIFIGTGCKELQRTLQNKVEQETTPSLITTPMRIQSPAFRDDGPIPSIYTCDGENKNPPLEFFDIPEETQSLALIVDDPDAPGGNWTHWTLWNIPSSTTGIVENSIPAGAVEGQTDFGRPGYGGPCPPRGTHHYQFKLYALDTTISLPYTASKQDLEQAIDGHIVAHARLIGLYTKEQ